MKTLLLVSLCVDAASLGKPPAYTKLNYEKQTHGCGHL